MSQAARELPYTLEDWIELEKSAHVRHEFEHGGFYVMSGGTDNHNAIAVNLSDALRPGARRKGCRRRIADMKTLANGNGYYPDVMVSCAPLGINPYIEYNPCLIVEVLSPTSINRDLIEKRDNYLLMPTLEQYVSVYPNKVRVEVYQRQIGYWQFLQYQALEDRLEITCLQDFITLEQIYEDVILEPETKESNQD